VIPPAKILIPADGDPRVAIGVGDGGVLDTREVVSAPLLTELPFSAIGEIVAQFANGAGQTGTGFLIAPAVVLTAGHVLHDRFNGPAVRVEFTPGCRKGLPETPRNSQVVGQRRARVSEDWARGVDQRLAFDYGAIFLPDARQFADCGTLALRDVESSYVERHVRLLTRSFIVAGFPEDKPVGTLWFASGRMIASAVGEVNHLIDTIRGQSGAPLIAVIVDRLTGKRVPLAIGIHSRPSLNLNYNQARRIDDRVLKDLKRWAEEIAETDE
jgi:V8-like Glu-specific endopeptidase